MLGFAPKEVVSFRGVIGLMIPRGDTADHGEPDSEAGRLRFRSEQSWEGIHQRALGVD